MTARTMRNAYALTESLIRSRRFFGLLLLGECNLNPQGIRHLLTIRMNYQERIGCTGSGAYLLGAADGWLPLKEHLADVGDIPPYCCAFARLQEGAVRAQVRVSWGCCPNWRAGGWDAGWQRKRYPQNLPDLQAVRVGDAVALLKLRRCQVEALGDAEQRIPALDSITCCPVCARRAGLR